MTQPTNHLTKLHLNALAALPTINKELDKLLADADWHAGVHRGREIINTLAATQLIPLPEGSTGVAATLPLPTDHWLYKPSNTQWDSQRMTGVDTPTPVLTHKKHGKAVRAAAEWAIRTATCNGTDPDFDFDPDSLAQCMVYALCGAYGATPVDESTEGLFI